MATCSLSLYFAIRWHYGTVPAVLASIALATNPWYYTTVAWDYPDGPAIAYGFLAAAFALRPHGSRAVNSILMAACLALSGFTNMSGAPMVLSVLIFPLWRWRRSLVELVREGVYILTGVAGTTIALVPMSKAVLGYWLFFMPQINLAREELGKPEILIKMWGTGDGFLLKAYHLFPVAFLLAFGLVLLATLRKRAPVAWPSYLALLACTMIYSFQEFVTARSGASRCVSQRLSGGAAVCAGRSDLRRTMARFRIAPRVDANDRPCVIGDCAASCGRRVPDELFGPGLWTRMFVAGGVAILLVAGWHAARTGFRVAIALLLMPLLFAGPARESFLYTSINTTSRDDFRALMSFNEVLKASRADGPQGGILGGPG